MAFSAFGGGGSVNNSLLMNFGPEIGQRASATAAPVFKNERSHLCDDEVPMKLCELCSELNLDLLLQAEGIQHQPTFAALENSVAEGCEMCVMFLGGLLKTYCELHKCTSRVGYEKFEEIARDTTVAGMMKGILEGSKVAVVGYEFGFPTWTVWGHFIVSNCRGSSDDRLFKTELRPKPDFSIAHNWIKECTCNHESCGSEDPQDPVLPTRVIDVGATTSEEPRLVISEGARGQYVTLSHCWGKTKPLTTTLENISEHTSSIPLLTMPRTFQDAVFTTRKLGFRYLWIDSLCIMQNSPEDWDIECIKMANIYKNSVVNICGTTAANSHAGFLKERMPFFAHPHLWQYHNPRGELQYATFRLWVYYPRFGNFRNVPELQGDEQISPLDKRAWILQEYLLAPRLLFIGPYRMYWECKSRLYFENVAMDAVTQDKGLHCSFLKSQLSQPLEFNPGKWYQIVQNYTERKLTQPTDKLPALSGIANWIFGGDGENYVAGLLKNDIHIGLTWRITHYQAGTLIPAFLEQHLPIYRGPSWSWVSTDCHVFSFAAQATRNMKQSANLLPIIKSASQKCKLEIHDVKIELVGQNPFGAVRAGSLKVRGRVKRAWVVGQNKGGGNMRFNVCAAGEEENWRGTLYPDYEHWIWREAWEYTEEEWPRFREEIRRAAATTKGNDQVAGVSALSGFKGALGSKPLPESVKIVEVNCLCVDVDSNNWHALAIEPIPQTKVQGSSAVELYKPCRRIGIMHSTDIYGSSANFDTKNQWRFEWFEDAPWELIELF